LAQAVGIAAGDLLEAVIGSGGDDKAGGKTDRVESQDGPKSDQLQGAFRGELALVRDSAQKADSAGQARANWPLNQAEAFEKIINAARTVRTGFSSEISLKLEPEHLGLMRVRLSVDDTQALNARIQVESNEARSLIENSLHRLRDSLAEQGLKVEKFSVDVRQNHNQESSQQHSSGPGRDGNDHSRGFGFADNDQNGNGAGQDGEISTAAADQKIEKLLKYSYSTLEWVA
ncbi:MAG: flagellar hook-length control protein FliK, partial [Candidatus Glassbacteria bacterium]